MKRALIVITGLTAVTLGVTTLRDRLPPDVDASCLAATHILGDVPVPPSSPLTGQAVVAQWSHGATLVDLATGQTTRFKDIGDTHDAVVTTDGRWGVVSDFGDHVADGFSGERLTVIDMSTRRVARTIRTPEYRGLHDIANRPGYASRILVTAQTARRVLEIDAASGQIISTIETRGDRSHTVAPSPDGAYAYTANEGTSTISRVDVANGTFMTHFQASEDVEGIAVANRGRDVWSGHIRLKAVRVQDAETGLDIRTITGFNAPVRIATTVDGKRVVISDPKCHAIVVADAESRSVRAVIRTGRDPVFVSEVGPDNRTAYASVSGSGPLGKAALIVFDLESAKLLARYPLSGAADGVGWGPRP